MEVFNGLSSSSAGDVMRSLFPGMLGSAKGPLKQMSGASSVEAPLSIDVGQRDYETVVSVGGSAKDQRVPGQELSGGGGQGQHASLNGHGCQRNGEFQGATGGGSSGIGGAPISGHASYVGGSGLPGGGPGVSGGGVGPPGGGPPFGGQGNGYGDFPGGGLPGGFPGGGRPPGGGGDPNLPCAGLPAWLGGIMAQQESVRAIELPSLPELSESEIGPLIVGDWLTTIGPFLRDINFSSSMWWDEVLQVAGTFYRVGLNSEPMERLRLTPVTP